MKRKEKYKRTVSSKKKNEAAKNARRRKLEGQNVKAICSLFSHLDKQTKDERT